VAKYMWVRRSNGTYYCCRSVVQTCSRARFVYVDKGDPSYNEATKEATDAINGVLRELEKYGPGDGRELSVIMVPDPNDKSDDPNSVPMLMWTWGDNISSEDDISTLRGISFS
jgi:hypothetical protein